MWLIFAIFSALFAGITTILSKVGMQHINSNVGTAIRTAVVFLFAGLMVFMAGVGGEITKIDACTLMFLVLSGLATGASWLCYFRALKYGNVNQVAPIDKSSTVLTMLLAFLFLREEITVLKVFCMLLIGGGTYLMIEKREEDVRQANGTHWFIWAVLSAVFAALTSILGKIGIFGIDSTLGTAIRTFVVLIMAWVVVGATGSQARLLGITKREVLFLILSGITTGLSWLCYYRALQDGSASVVVPIDKLSILVTVAFSSLVLREKLTGKSLCGLTLLTAGTLLLLL